MNNSTKRPPQAIGRPYQVHRLAAAALVLVSISALLTGDPSPAWPRGAIQFASFTIAALVTGWMISSRRAPRLTAPIVVCCAIPVWGVLQLTLGISVHEFATRNAVLDSAAYAGLFFIAAQTLESAMLRRQVLQVLFLFSFLVSAAAFFRPDLLAAAGGHYCVFVELMLPIGLYLASASPDARLRYVWAALSASLIASALIAGSRAGCALIAAEVIAVPLIRAARTRVFPPGSWMPIALAVALVAIFAIGVGSRQLGSRFASGDGRDHRGELVAVAVNMARDRPLTGFGLGSFEALYPSRVLLDSGMRVNHAHNDWAEWAATGGLPLLAMYLTLFGLTLPLTIRATWSIGVVAMCLHALVDCPFEIPALLVLNAILLGAASSQS